MYTGFFLSSQFTKKREGRHSSKIRFYKERDSPTFIKLPTLVRALPVPPERDRRTRGPISIIPQIPIIMRVRHKHPNINPLPILTLPIYIYIKGNSPCIHAPERTGMDRVRPDVPQARGRRRDEPGPVCENACEAEEEPRGGRADVPPVLGPDEGPLCVVCALCACVCVR